MLGQPSVGFDILGAGCRNDFRRKHWTWRLTIETNAIQPVANKLLVEARLVLPRLVDVGGPEPRGIGCEHLVDEHEVAILVETPLELGVGQDDAASGSEVVRPGVKSQRKGAEPGHGLMAGDLAALHEGNILIMQALLGLGARGKNGPG